MATLCVWKLVYSIKQILKLPELCSSRVHECSRAKNVEWKQFGDPSQISLHYLSSKSRSWRQNNFDLRQSICVFTLWFIEAIVGVHCFAWILCLMVLCIHLCHWDRFNFRVFQKRLFTNQTLAVWNHHELLCFLSVARLYPQSIAILSILVQRHSLASPGLVLVLDKMSASLGCDLLVPSYLRQMDNKQILKVHPVH